MNSGIPDIVKWKFRNCFLMPEQRPSHQVAPRRLDKPDPRRAVGFDAAGLCVAMIGRMSVADITTVHVVRVFDPILTMEPDWSAVTSKVLRKEVVV
jgi:hypothetical protein